MNLQTILEQYPLNTFKGETKEELTKLTKQMKQAYEQGREDERKEPTVCCRECEMDIGLVDTCVCNNYQCSCHTNTNTI